MRRPVRSACLAACLALACLSARAAGPASAHLGLAIRDVPGVGCVVTGVGPGPLGGTGLAGPLLRRPDLLVSVDGMPASRATLRAALGAKAPDDPIRLEVRRALPLDRPNWVVPTAAGQVAYAEASETIEVRLADATLWNGSVRSETDAAPLADELPPGLFAAEAAATVAALDRDAELASSVAAVRAGGRLQSDPGTLPAVRAALDWPLSLPEIALELTAVDAPAERPFELARRTLARALGLPDEPAEGHGSLPVPTPSHGIFALDFLVNGPRPAIEEAVAAAGIDLALVLAGCDAIDAPFGGDFLREPGVAARMRAMRIGATLDLAPFVAALGQFDVDFALGFDPMAAEPIEVPEELVGAVDGPILAAERIPDLGWAVVGSVAANRYDLARIAAVLDLGGDDEYRLSEPVFGMRGIVDLGGNDRYLGHPRQGIGCGLGGAFLVDDRGSGRDRHEGSFGVAGCGVFGVGAVIDRGGDDLYEGRSWSQGAGAWGGGILVDLGGSDRYDAAWLSQAIGGPRGAGVLLDRNGNDLYRIDGPIPSAYDTPATFLSLGQGCGLGLRNHAFGGVGILRDDGGDDRYEAGEFAQGIGYYHGLGVLHDRGGHDRYAGDRYGQGAAAHQAAGILIDDAGDDTYLGRTAASQGAAWDQSIAWLVDRAGDDSFQADGLAQGAAAQQAIAVLLDLGGRDRRIARGGSTRGASGEDGYHFTEPPPVGGAYSFSLHLDLGGDPDTYSDGRADGRSMTTGAPGRSPELATFHGIFRDDGPVAPAPATPRP